MSSRIYFNPSEDTLVYKYIDSYEWDNAMKLWTLLAGNYCKTIINAEISLLITWKK